MFCKVLLIASILVFYLYKTNNKFKTSAHLLIHGFLGQESGSLARSLQRVSHYLIVIWRLVWERDRFQISNVGISNFLTVVRFVVVCFTKVSKTSLLMRYDIIMGVTFHHFFQGPFLRNKSHILPTLQGKGL